MVVVKLLSVVLVILSYNNLIIQSFKQNGNHGEDVSHAHPKLSSFKYVEMGICLLI